MKNKSVGIYVKNKVTLVRKITYLALSCFLFVSSSKLLLAKHNNHPPGYAVASANSLATEVGMQVLEQGGNAFDAAVAVTAMLSVVNPYGGGLGGGGFWLLYRADTDESVFIDGREKAPLAAQANMYLDEAGEPIAGASLTGPLAAAIPGLPAALAYISQHYGSLPLQASLQPAIETAKHGFPVNKLYQHWLAESDTLEVMRSYPSSATIFLHENDIPEHGSLIIQKDLAHTLEAIAKAGHQGFYGGEFAQHLVNEVRKYGGIWQLEDLTDYSLELRKPLTGHYQDIDIITAPLPSAGGIEILTTLNILEPFDLEDASSLLRTHQILEAMRLAYWQASVDLSDPSYLDVDVKPLLSKQRANQLRALIAPDKATPSISLGEQPLLNGEKAHTTHFSIIDQDGNRVASTFTLNTMFGSKFVVPETGVLLNNTMDDFAVKPGTPNVYGLVGSYANRIQPGKRPVSSMSPTFLITQDRIGILGTPGGSRIPTMVLLGILDFAGGNKPSSWVSLPRFHHQYLPDLVEFEAAAFSLDEQQALTDMGYLLKEQQPYGDMQAVMWDKANHRLYAASDPRDVGTARVAEKEEQKAEPVIAPLLHPSTPEADAPLAP